MRDLSDITFAIQETTVIFTGETLKGEQWMEKRFGSKKKQLGPVDAKQLRKDIQQAGLSIEQFPK